MFLLYNQIVLDTTRKHKNVPKSCFVPGQLVWVAVHTFSLNFKAKKRINLKALFSPVWFPCGLVAHYKYRLSDQQQQHVSFTRKYFPYFHHSWWYLVLICALKHSSLISPQCVVQRLIWCLPLFCISTESKAVYRRQVLLITSIAMAISLLGVLCMALYCSNKWEQKLRQAHRFTALCSLILRAQRDTTATET